MRSSVKKILVIDDEPSVRTIIKLVLERGGYHVEVAENGRVGVELFKKDTFDFVITDIIMPDEDGIKTIINIKEINPDVPIMAMSGGGRRGNTDFLEAARQIGACETLEKPFEPMSILEKVNLQLA